MKQYISNNDQIKHQTHIHPYALRISLQTQKNLDLSYPDLQANKAKYFH